MPAPVAAALQRAQVPASAASFYVVKIGAPQARASWNAQQPMNPASTMKLVTTFAGLQLLGPDYRWQTSLYADSQPDGYGMVNGNVYLRGRGDPKLVPEEMAGLVASARAAGATTINGDLVLDRSYFADGLNGNGTIDGEVQRAYNVGPAPCCMRSRRCRSRSRPTAPARPSRSRSRPRSRNCAWTTA